MTPGNVLGLGNDIIEIERIKKSLQDHGARMLERLFSEKERAYCDQFEDPFPSYAGRFAAKEAIVKALGTGFGSEASWLDIEILNDEKGKPLVYLSPKLQEKLGNTKVLVTISHCRTLATAVSIWASTT
ncbi:MAG: holo-ACP synthase [Verrucomicrobia bacterium]|nr:holo-ACP synthase [Verrucomicrobiota bacterium]